MFKLKKNNNILVLLRDRELQNVPSAQKTSANILSCVIRWETTRFEPAWKHSCRSGVVCDDGKLYLHQYRDIFSLWGTRNVPYPLYKMGSTTNAVIVDGLSCCQKHPASVYSNEKPPSHYRDALVALSDDNWLRSYDQENGWLLQEIYLGHQERLSKYKYCDWETYPTRIAIRWIYRQTRTRSNSVANQTASNNPWTDMFADVAVFTVFPLQFVSRFLIKHSVFNFKITRININDGMLIVSGGYTREGTVYIYSLDDVMQRNMLYTAKLGESCSDFSDKVVGSYPAGLPFNCVIKDLPPCLFSVDCAEFNVMFGLVPCHYVVKMPNTFWYDIRRLSDDESPDFECIEQPDGKYFKFDPCQVETFQFHYDDSNRMIHKRPCDVVIYRYCPETESIEKLFTLDFLNSSTPQVNRYRFMSERLKIDRPNCVMCLDYEHELDMIAILGCDSAHMGIIKLFDNHTGALVKCVQTNLTIDDDDMGYLLVFSLDTIVITEGGRYPRTSCVVYKLCAQNRPIATVRYRKCRRNVDPF